MPPAASICIMSEVPDLGKPRNNGDHESLRELS